MRTIVAVLALWAVSCASLAQGLRDIDDVQAVTDKVMAQVAKGDLEGGLLAFKSLTIIPPAEFDAMVGQAKNQMPMISGRFGESLGYEFIGRKTVGPSLASLTYIHRFDKHAMRWVFYLYRGKDGWVVNTFRFDDQWPALLDQR